MTDIFEFDDRNHAERFVGTLHDPGATTGHVLTVQADKSIKAKPGGGGGSGVQVVTVPVSSAQILDLFNTPVTLIPGTAGKVTVVNGAAIVYLAGLVPYLDGDPSNQLGIFTPPHAAGWFAHNSTGFWDQAASQALASGSGVIAFGAPNLGALTDLAGADVILSVDTANPTLGDGTLLVTLSYLLAPTV